MVCLLSLLGSVITGYVIGVSGAGPTGSTVVGPDARNFVFTSLAPQTVYQ